MGVAARRSFNARLVTMTNRVASNARKATRGLEVLTGVIRKYKSNGKKDRALIRSQNKALGKDLQAKIDRYIQEGEARAKRIAHRARRNLKAAKKSMLLEISARVEATADKIFKSVQGNHKKIADNYLSLKAYCVSARGKLSNIASKINGLVNEYSGVLARVRRVWPMGLGKYLLMKLEESMLAKGVLQVDKVSGKKGNFVFVNGRTVGLSNKLNDFESLA